LNIVNDSESDKIHSIQKNTYSIEKINQNNSIGSMYKYKHKLF